MDVKEKIIKGKNGYTALVLIIVALVVTLACSICGFVFSTTGDTVTNPALLTVAIVLIVLHSFIYIFLAGLKSLKPNEAYVFKLNSQLLLYRK